MHPLVQLAVFVGVLLCLHVLVRIYRAQRSSRRDEMLPPASGEHFCVCGHGELAHDGERGLPAACGVPGCWCAVFVRVHGGQGA